MNKTWIIFNRRKQDVGRRDGWNYFKEINVSRQQAIHEMKRQVEKDNNGREWAVFEMVGAFAAEVKVVEVQIAEPNEAEIPEIVLEGMPVQVIRLDPEPWPVEEDLED